MDVTQENLLETVRNIREMIKDHILPRLTDIECELSDLRSITWPVCQNIIDEKGKPEETISLDGMPDVP